MNTDIIEPQQTSDNSKLQQTAGQQQTSDDFDNKSKIDPMLGRLYHTIGISSILFFSILIVSIYLLRDNSKYLTDAIKSVSQSNSKSPDKSAVWLNLGWVVIWGTLICISFWKLSKNAKAYLTLKLASASYSILSSKTIPDIVYDKDYLLEQVKNRLIDMQKQTNLTQNEIRNELKEITEILREVIRNNDTALVKTKTAASAVSAIQEAVDRI